jgi:ribonuclease HII
VIEGDSRSAAIAAASVIAKVTRDRCMHRADGEYPAFGFCENVGYSTPEHRTAIVEHGPSRLHRRSFQSIAYSQLALTGDADGSEGVADPFAAADAAVLPDLDADHVEADRAEAG